MVCTVSAIGDLPFRVVDSRFGRSWHTATRPPKRNVRFNLCNTIFSIGDGRLAVAAVVAGRSRIGAGAALPDFEQSTRIGKHDQADVGGDCMDAEHRGVDRVAVDRGFSREPLVERSVSDAQNM